jgi:hypothetical protein
MRDTRIKKLSHHVGTAAVAAVEKEPRGSFSSRKMIILNQTTTTF